MELRLLCPSILLLSLGLQKISLFQRLICYFYVKEANFLQVDYTERSGMSSFQNGFYTGANLSNSSRSAVVNGREFSEYNPVIITYCSGFPGWLLKLPFIVWFLHFVFVCF